MDLGPLELSELAIALQEVLGSPRELPKPNPARTLGSPVLGLY